MIHHVYNMFTQCVHDVYKMLDEMLRPRGGVLSKFLYIYLDFYQGDLQLTPITFLRIFYKELCKMRSKFWCWKNQLTECRIIELICWVLKEKKGLIIVLKDR